MKKVLYVDACVSRANSRTEALAQALLERLGGDGVSLETLVLEEEEALHPLRGADIEKRTAQVAAGDFTGPLFAYAKQFAAADEVVIAAPYWDFSFPSMLKIYFEHLCAQGVTFTYSDQGIPEGLVNVQRVHYLTTVGGYAQEWDYGWLQVQALCKLYFGIDDLRCFRAEGLDIVTNDADAIMAAALEKVRAADLS